MCIKISRYNLRKAKFIYYKCIAKTIICTPH